MINELSQKELQLEKNRVREQSLIEQYNCQFKILDRFSDYAICEDGRVYSFKINDFRKFEVHKQGYYKVKLVRDDGVVKNMRVNRLVALAFIPNDDPIGKPLVGHADDCKTNNNVSNLYWTNSVENARHNGLNERYMKKVKCIENDKIFPSVGEAANYANVAICSISNCLAGRQKTAGGYHWEYAVGKED